MRKNIAGRLRSSEPRNARPQALLITQSATILEAMLPEISDATGPPAMEAIIRMPTGSSRRDAIQTRRLFSRGGTQPAASAQTGATPKASSPLKMAIGAATLTSRVGRSMVKRNELALGAAGVAGWVTVIVLPPGERRGPRRRAPRAG